jgi:cytochrome c-type biogenesis protein CcmH
MSLERFEEAADAYTSAHNLANQPKLVRPDIVASLAESSYMATGGQFTPLIREYLRTARAASPRESKVLFYMGLDFARQKKFQDAIQIWTDLLSITPANAPRRVNLQHQISKAAKAGNIDATAVKSRLAPSVPPAASRATPSAAPADVPGASAGYAKAAEEMSDQDRQAFIRSMVERLAERLKETPTDIEGWKRLARAYQVLGDTAKAAAVVERIRQLEGGKRGRR